MFSRPARANGEAAMIKTRIKLRRNSLMQAGRRFERSRGGYARNRPARIRDAECADPCLAVLSVDRQQTQRIFLPCPTECRLAGAMPRRPDFRVQLRAVAIRDCTG